MCDKGCDVLFRAQDCEIKSTSTGKLLAKGVRTENNVYILKEESEECYIRREVLGIKIVIRPKLTGVSQ